MSFTTIFAAGGIAIPLYDTYRAEDGVTNTDLARVAVVYMLAAVVGLVVLGRLSDYLGRKAVSIAALLVAAAGCLVFLTVHSVVALIVGRGLQGLAAGLASSALAAYAVDTAPKRPAWLLPAVTSAATTVGLSAGAFTSGVLVEFGPSPRMLVFVVFAAMLIAAVVWIFYGPETVTRRKGVVRSLVPAMTLPASARPYLPASAAVFASTWALGGYYQSFGPSVAADDLSSDSAVVAAAVFASYMAPVILGGPVTTKLTPIAAQRFGMILVFGCAAGLVTALSLGNTLLFIGSGVVGGIGMGAGMSGSMRLLLPTAGLHERAGLLSVIYALSYTGAALPSLITGQLVRFRSLLDVTVGYTVLVGAALVLVLATGRRST
ncbi:MULTISPECIES: MFS transporter [Nocardiaceae]|uniref:MFS transporter n=1 Tax=Nocardiaceae TaxID=85025 RepID=UPI000691A063|nr:MULTISPECIES: MFS transporter [Rhodococcus]